MKTIIFVCHGNICRSPCAEVIAKNYLEKIKVTHKINVYSRALSYEEYGNDIYPKMKKVLSDHHQKYPIHKADILKENEVIDADYIYYMDEYNYQIIKYTFNKYINKFHLLSELTNNKYIEDPWYTNKFLDVYLSIKKSVICIIDNLINLDK